MKANKLNRKINARTRKEKEVWEACEYLKTHQKKITYYAIGEQLINFGYKRGSNSDIRRYLTTWKQYCTPNKTKKATAPNIQIQEHEPLQTQTASPSMVTDNQLLDIAVHYAQQFDRLLSANESLRHENKILRKRLKALEDAFHSADGCA